MKTKTITTYKFEELNKEIQDKLIEKYINNFEVYDDWYEFIFENIEDSIKEKTGLEIEGKNLSFYFNRGCNIYFNSSEVVKALQNKYNHIEDFYLPDKFGLFSNYLGGGLNGGLCSSDYDVNRIEFEEFDEEDTLEEVIYNKNNEKIKEQIEEDLNKIQEILKKGFIDLWDEYNSYFTEDYARDSLINNEEEFDSEGNRV